ncbi:hypothetical protein CDHC03_1929 [Corynebacterium diphtheriae HC03]|nr:hypothetical protein CDHC03_1929 [Corynebacterium diphtheriae HC03]
MIVCRMLAAWRWWALVGAPPPLTPEKDGTSHQIYSNGRFGSDLV